MTTVDFLKLQGTGYELPDIRRTWWDLIRPSKEKFNRKLAN